MLVISIIGKSQSGKTTLIERLIPELTLCGYRVGTIKHTHHDFELDTPGKDSYRHRVAGAAVVILRSKNQVAVLKNAPQAISVSELVNLDLVGDIDIMLVEGFKQEQIGMQINLDQTPQIEIQDVVNSVVTQISSKKEVKR